MPQPASVTAAADALIAVFQRAQADIQAQLAVIAGEVNQARRRAHLRDLAQSIDDLMAGLQHDAKAWLEQRLPEVYAAGGHAATPALGREFEWATIHVDAVHALAGEAWDDLLAATRYVSSSTKAWIRTEARRQTGLSLTEGRTAQQAARAFVSAAAGELVDDVGPVGVIRYADGSYRRLADHADMLLRTTTARAYNAGTINQSKRFGVGWMECFDGAECGLTGHDDGEKPDGKVYPVDVAELHPLSHPRCRRSWSPRPDVASHAEAALAEPTASAAQRADQAQAEQNRSDLLTRRRVARKAREGRAARRQR